MQVLVRVLPAGLSCCPDHSSCDRVGFHHVFPGGSYPLHCTSEAVAVGAFLGGRLHDTDVCKGSLLRRRKEAELSSA